METLERQGGVMTANSQLVSPYRPFKEYSTRKLSLFQMQMKERLNSKSILS